MYNLDLSVNSLWKSIKAMLCKQLLWFVLCSFFFYKKKFLINSLFTYLNCYFIISLVLIQKIQFFFLIYLMIFYSIWNAHTQTQSMPSFFYLIYKLISLFDDSECFYSYIYNVTIIMNISACFRILLSKLNLFKIRNCKINEFLIIEICIFFYS